MALIWAESFDLYGTSMTFLSQRGYATATGALINNVLTSRTGTGCYNTASTGERKLIRLNGSTINRCTQGAAFFAPTIGASNAFDQQGFFFRIAGDDNAIRVCVNSLLGISIFQSGSLVGQSLANAFSLNSWFHIEAQVNVGSGSGSIEVRINGSLVALVTGLTIGAIEGYGIGKRGSASVSDLYYDDWTVADGAGTLNNSFLGDRRCNTSYTNADTVLADWTRTPAGPGFSILDNSPPVDTQFVQANAVGNISEFGVEPIGIATNDIAGVIVIGRAAKIDAGTATFRLGINSAGTVSNGPAEAPNVAPSFSYFSHIVERNPNGNIPWTRTAANAALPRITRES